jgi:hypothetical protein
MFTLLATIPPARIDQAALQMPQKYSSNFKNSKYTAVEQEFVNKIAFSWFFIEAAKTGNQCSYIPLTDYYYFGY